MKQAEVEAATIQAETEAEPSVPTETEPAVVEEKATEQIASEKVETPAPKLQKKALITSFVMLRERDFLNKKS
jgi:hypothetical protein